jgi:hypothetical protein
MGQLKLCSISLSSSILHACLASRRRSQLLLSWSSSLTFPPETSPSSTSGSSQSSSAQTNKSPLPLLSYSHSYPSPPVDLLPSTFPPPSPTPSSFSFLSLKDVGFSFSVASPSCLLSVPCDLDLLERAPYTQCRPRHSPSHLTEDRCQHSNKLTLITIGFRLIQLCWCVLKVAIWQARTDVFAVIAPNSFAKHFQEPHCNVLRQRRRTPFET